MYFAFTDYIQYIKIKFKGKVLCKVSLYHNFLIILSSLYEHAYREQASLGL